MKTIKAAGVSMHVVVLALLAATCAKGQTSSEAEKANFCDVVASPADYDGKIISIEVILQRSFHSLSLYDTACAQKEGFDVTTQAILPDGWQSLPIGKKLGGIIKHGRPAKIQVVGTFRSSVIRGQDGQRFRFSIFQINSVSEATSKRTTPALSYMYDGLCQHIHFAHQFTGRTRYRIQPRLLQISLLRVGNGAVDVT